MLDAGMSMVGKARPAVVGPFLVPEGPFGCPIAEEAVSVIATYLQSKDERAK
jgi:hypothetical protein